MNVTLNAVLRTVSLIAVMAMAAEAEWTTGVAIGLNVYLAALLPVAVDAYAIAALAGDKDVRPALTILWITMTTGHAWNVLDQAGKHGWQQTALELVLTLAVSSILVGVTARLHVLMVAAQEARREAQEAEDRRRSAERVQRLREEEERRRAEREAAERAEAAAERRAAREARAAALAAQAAAGAIEAGPERKGPLGIAPPPAKSAPSREQVREILAATAPEDRSPTALARTHGGSEAYWRKVMRELESVA